MPGPIRVTEHSTEVPTTVKYKKVKASLLNNSNTSVRSNQFSNTVNDSLILISRSVLCIV